MCLLGNTGLLKKKKKKNSWEIVEISCFQKHTFQPRIFWYGGKNAFVTINFRDDFWMCKMVVSKRNILPDHSKFFKYGLKLFLCITCFCPDKLHKMFSQPALSLCGNLCNRSNMLCHLKQQNTGLTHVFFDGQHLKHLSCPTGRGLFYYLGFKDKT